MPWCAPAGWGQWLVARPASFEAKLLACYVDIRVVRGDVESLRGRQKQSSRPCPSGMAVVLTDRPLHGNLLLLPIVSPGPGGVSGVPEWWL